jgi:hypothetical protein
MQVVVLAVLLAGPAFANKPRSDPLPADLGKRRRPSAMTGSTLTVRGAANAC